MTDRHRAETLPHIAAEPLFEFDSKVRDAMVPLRDLPVVKIAGTASDVADQWPLRLICGGVLAAGLLRRDARMIATGMRMLAAHEIATLSKNAIKRRVDRSRPRSAAGDDGHKPRPGRRTGKEETSFPSGHSAGAMAVASAFASGFPAYRTAAMIAAGSAALAQIPRCAHYPSDVAAGLIIGACSNRAAGGMLHWMSRLISAFAKAAAVRSVSRRHSAETTRATVIPPQCSSAPG